MNRSLRSTFQRSLSTVRHRDPLKILFCGSDTFSIASLKSIIQLRNDWDQINSIKVLCRTDKHTGRGRKILSQVPIKSVAEEWDLPIQQIDTFENFEAASLDFNLIIAVSFGLLIPADIIRNAKYGGLNVHPSFLPDLKGAAPIHHAIFYHRAYTGVSIQTLHPTKFDHGRIIAQTPLPGMPISRSTTPESINPLLASEGARLLTRVLLNGLFVEPVIPIEQSVQEMKFITNGDRLRFAPKLKTHNRKVDFTKLTSDQILLRQRAFGVLWDDTLWAELSNTNDQTRIVFDKLGSVTDFDGHIPPGQMILHDTTRVLVGTADETAIEVLACTLAGEKKEGGRSMKKIRSKLMSRQ